jgi:predicted GNAT family N-acyltransferase
MRHDVIEVHSTIEPREVAAALHLRQEVFCGEQGVPVEEEIDGRDAEAQHLVAVEDERVVATCRLLHGQGVTKLGRMAVAREARRRGIATALLRAADTAAEAAGSTRIVLHAQTDARALYAAEGYAGRGEVFYEAGIEHICMEKEIGHSPISFGQGRPEAGLRSQNAGQDAPRR